MAIRTLTMDDWLDPGSFQSTINSLKTRFVSGGKIYLSDLESLRSLLVTLYSHTHSTRVDTSGKFPVYEGEYAALVDYGDGIGGPGTQGPYQRTSSSVSGAPSLSAPSGWSAGSKITATHHNFLSGNTAQMKTHSHTVIDSLYP